MKDMKVNEERMQTSDWWGKIFRAKIGVWQLARQGSWSSFSSRREPPSRREACKSSKLFLGQGCCFSWPAGFAILVSALGELFCLRWEIIILGNVNPFRKSEWKVIFILTHSHIFLLFCKREKQSFLPFHFAFQNDDEELNPILSRLEVVAILICLCIPYNSYIWWKIIDVLNDIFALSWIWDLSSCWKRLFKSWHKIYFQVVNKL